MRSLTSIIGLIIILPLLAPAQTKYRIVVLGSSTAYGTGATTPDSSWVGRTKAYYKTQQQLDTIINLAVPGSFSDSGVKLLPRVMSLNPDIVLVSFPTNDIIAGLGVPLLMSNFRKIYSTVTAAGKKCFIATTQPRTDPLAEHLLRVGRDSVIMEFPNNYMNFYDPLVLPGSDDPNPIYIVDGIHPNNAGHKLLFQAVAAAQVIPIPPLALTLTAFSGLRTGQSIELSWTATATDGDIDFFIERSTERAPFQTIHKTKAVTDGALHQYTFIDQAPPAAKCSYRIRTITDGNAVEYSRTLSFGPLTTGLAIQKISYGGRNGITTTIDLPRDGSFYLAIFNAAGIPVKRQSYAGRAPVMTLDIPLPAMPSGIYFLRIATSDGQTALRSFAVLE